MVPTKVIESFLNFVAAVSPLFRCVPTRMCATTMLLYSLKKGVVSAKEGELAVPFEVKDIKLWGR